MQAAQHECIKVPHNPGNLNEDEFELLYALKNLGDTRPDFYRTKAERDLEKLSQKGKQDLFTLLHQLADKSYIDLHVLESMSLNFRCFDEYQACTVSEKRSAFAEQFKVLALSEKAEEALEPYRMNNAVIMAAGFSSRFAPVSYERPKGTLRVKGEVLIERQIEQLLEAGIDEIVVVLGYLKEEFFYLEQKYPQLTLLINERYHTHNNMSSLYVARNRLGKTYICCSDNYYLENIFEDYVFASFYCTIYMQGPSDEMLIHTDKHRVINQIELGGRDAYAIMGHAAVDSYFIQELFRYVDSCYDRPENASKLWEDFWRERLDSLKLRARNYESSLIKEFDSLDDLRKFDPQFIVNSDALAFTHIQQVLRSSLEHIEGFLPVKIGANRSFSFVLDGQRYMYRHPVAGSYVKVNRLREKHANARAHIHGIDGGYLYFDAERGWKLSYFMDSSRPFDPAQDQEALSALLARLHTIDADELPDAERETYLCDPRRELQTLLEPIKQAGHLNTSETHVLERQALRLTELMEELEVFMNEELDRKVLCHQDLSPDNLCLSYDYGLQLIDWESAAYTSAYFDYASYAVSLLCSDEQARAVFTSFNPRFARLQELKTVDEHEFNAISEQSLLLWRYLSSMAYMAYYNFVRSKAKELQTCIGSSSVQVELWRLSSYYMKAALDLGERIGSASAH